MSPGGRVDKKCDKRLKGLVAGQFLQGSLVWPLVEKKGGKGCVRLWVRLLGWLPHFTGEATGALRGDFTHPGHLAGPGPKPRSVRLQGDAREADRDSLLHPLNIHMLTRYGPGIRRHMALNQGPH